MMFSAARVFAPGADGFSRYRRGAPDAVSIFRPKRTASSTDQC